MNFRPRTWFLLSIVLFIAAWFFWRKGDERRDAQPRTTVPAATSQTAPAANASAATPAKESAAVVFPQDLVVSEIATNLSHPANPKDYRVSNTALPFDELMLKDSALLLKNAWIDTGSKSRLPIPAELRATQDPGSYVVQSRGVITPQFRASLASVGATVVSYIPNNAYLVRVTAQGAQKLSNIPQVQSVLPYEPFYKVDMELMPEALGQKANPAGKAVRLTVFEGQQQSAIAAIKSLGATVVGQDKTPFGPQLIVQVGLTSENAIQKLAQVNGVQGIEKYHERVVMNDLSRERVRVSANTVTNGNYLNLTGTNVVVNVNDTGAYAGHPDLTNRVFGSSVDLDGHGTHVVGTILSSGSNSPSGLVLTNFGSLSNANFRGMAPAASAFVFPFDTDFSDGVNTFGSDAALAELAARTNMFVFGKTNTLISNNSWGYGARTYNSSAAIFDGAARDALPDIPGSQEVLFIFAAGNAGGAGNVCFPSENADSISSPATMKNGLAVGAIENLRNITTNVIVTLGKTNIYYTCNGCDFVTNNEAFLHTTDSSNQVAGFSSRGNTGISSRSVGRFKPDLVAPGTFVVSTRPPDTNWNADAYYNPTNVYDGYRFLSLEIKGGATNHFAPVLVPDNTIELRFRAASTIPLNEPLLIYASTSPAPASVAGSFVGTNLLVIPTPSTNCFGDLWFVDVVNPTNKEVVYDFRASVLVTNKGSSLIVLSNLNEALDPNGLYRFETGSSMSAPVVSGTAALMQEFFEQRLGRTNSPALMKALLINGARSVSSAYHLQVDPLVNSQGWGLVNIQNSIPALLNTLSNTTDEAKWPIKFFDQSPTNALSTGQSHTYNVGVSNGVATLAPLRITLVWTDPPGNPAATINLVNDLDLIVTNNDTGEVFFGNNFTGASDFTDVNMLTSNAVPIIVAGGTNDLLNNVENVYINAPLGTNYSVTVSARRVNVNAVIANTNDIVQDYALVIASGNTTISNIFTISGPTFAVNTNAEVNFLDIGVSDNTNAITGNASRGIVVEAQHVGANSSLIVSTNGTNLQWRFYVVTNATTFSNAVFSIFSAPTLSVARNISDPYAVPQPIGPNSQLPLGRNISADLDLFVTTNSAITNLDVAAVETALKSTERFSDEMIVITNSVQNDVYYIGVKSEDQQGGEFSLGVQFMLRNPSLFNPDGSFSMDFSGGDIVDGTPDSPGGVMILPQPGPIGKFVVGAVVIQDQITHELFGDLTGIVKHNSKSVYLNNHNSFMQGQSSGTVSNTYDDMGILTNSPANLTAVEGPGSLFDYLGESGSGMWQYFMIDNALSFTGRLDGAVVTLFPQTTNTPTVATSGQLFSGTVDPGESRYGILVVPPSAVSLTLKVSLPNGGEGPVDLFVRRDDGSSPRLPNVLNYDYTKTILFPGDSLTIGRSDIPPLVAGSYIVAISCPLSSPTTSFDVFFDIKLDLADTAPDKRTGTNLVVLPDQTFTNSLTSTINVNLLTNQLVSDVRVGLRIDHPRVSDLVLRLVSPEGTSVLLSENRGHLTTNGFGLGTNQNELAYSTFSEDTNLASIPIKFASSSNFLEFVPPVLIATNFMEDTTNAPSFSRTAGSDVEDRNFIVTGTNQGTVTISYDFLSVPDQLRVYYDGAIIFDTGVVSGSNTVVVPYGPGAATFIEIVMNEGNSTNVGTVWSYNFSLSPAPPPMTNQNQRATGVAIVGNELYISGITEAAATNGIIARYGLPMQDNALPIWELDWPDLKGGTRLNGVAATTDRAFVAGSSSTVTTDATLPKEPKGITVGFPSTAPVVNPADVYGSLWHKQTPGFTNVDGFEQLHAITATVEDVTNHYVYVTGDAQANPTNFGRLYLSKLDEFGTLVWTTNDATGTLTTNYSSGRAITQMNGDIYVAGANGDSGVTNAYLVRFNTNGNQVWAQTTPYLGEFRGIAAYGGSIYTVGVFDDGGGTNHCIVHKWDDAGNTIWTNQLTISADGDELNAVVGYGDRLYAVGSTSVGGTNKDVLLLELDQVTGGVITNTNSYAGITTYDGGVLGDDIATGIATDGLDIYIVGETHHWTNRLDSDVLMLRYRIKNDYLPEEPFSLFTGEYANGDWRLVIWDNRADTVVSAGRLLGWQLQLTLGATNNSADILFHDVPYTNSVSEKNNMRYFIVNVPYTASRATISLTNLTAPPDGNLNLWFKQDGLPVPGSAGRVNLLTNVPEGAVVLDSTTPTVPELLPGQRFYLGVEYLGTPTNQFKLQVTFDSTATTFLLGGGATSGSQPAGPSGNNLYQFRIEPTSPIAAFQLRNLSGDVEVFLRRGNLPNSSSYDFHQTFVGTNFGQVIIQPGGTLPDVSGTWFASISKLTTNSVAYTVVVTNANRSPIFGTLNNQAVTEGSLLSFTAPVTDPDGAAQQLTFALESGAPAGATINSTNGLFSWTPTAAQGPSTNVVTIRVTDNGVPPITTTKTISIIVNEKVPVFAAPTVVSGKLQITWSSLSGQNYEVQTSTNLVNWTTIATNSASGSTTTYLDSEAQAAKEHKFYRVRPVP